MDEFQSPTLFVNILTCQNIYKNKHFKKSSRREERNRCQISEII